MASIAPAVGPDTTIVPHAERPRPVRRARQKFGADKVAGGLARISGMLGPNGEVMHSSPFAGVSFGERYGQAGPQAPGGTRRGRQRRPASTAASTPNINQDLWDKWIMLTSHGLDVLHPCAARRATSWRPMKARALMLETARGMPQGRRRRRLRSREKGIANLKTFLTQRNSVFAASMLGDLEKGGPRSRTAT